MRKMQIEIPFRFSLTRVRRAKIKSQPTTNADRGVGTIGQLLVRMLPSVAIMKINITNPQGAGSKSTL